jgi:hypothetical protein
MSALTIRDAIGRSSRNQNRGIARATQGSWICSVCRREAPDPGVRMATAAGGDSGDSDQADGAPARRLSTRRSPAQLGGKAP